MKVYQAIPGEQDIGMTAAKNFNDLWRDQNNDHLEKSWYLSVQSQVNKLYVDCDIKKILESLPNKHQTSNNPCDHIIYSRWSQRTVS